MLGLGLLALVLWFTAPSAPEGLERVYARGLYPRLAALLVPVGDALPFSLAALLAFALPLGVGAGVALRLRAGRPGRALELFLAALILGGVSFVVLWGANYRRMSVETQFGLDPALAAGSLGPLLDELARVIAATAAGERDEARAAASLRRSLQDTLEATTGLRPTLPERFKTLPPGLLIRLGGASGVMSPWTLEPHLDGALPEVSRLAIGLHELAHVAGYAGEADADFVAALAGLRATDLFGRYAVALRTFGEALAQLPAAERALWSGRLPEVARRDLARMAEPYARFRAPRVLGVWQRRLYDRYLRSQGVAAGVEDYSRALRLLLGAQRQGLLEPP